jgi:hypothetical protein
MQFIEFWRDKKNLYFGPNVWLKDRLIRDQSIYRPPTRDSFKAKDLLCMDLKIE